MGLPEGTPDITEVVIELTEENGKTVMTMTHKGVPEGSPGEGGWQQAFDKLAGLAEGSLSERSELIMLYALCGFANFGSLGIMLGGIGTMVPERRPEIASLGIKSIMAGTLATLMTGAWVGVLL